ncbi:TolC family outer membrane protein [Oecophyllibacter saccharovorans]|uniref:TolC family outer membrane protein n=1 Tax=Oecophyllibacter saccharovorans TaxID=2558360 RepID=UPI00116C31D3|nr:TolC family outer membrane protein [Oecophyllibacter saccharovorans]TPW34701.1 secretion protein [Oecophyllibacter saccharovorans]
MTDNVLSAARKTSFPRQVASLQVQAGISLLALIAAAPAFAQKYDGSGAPVLVPHTLQQALGRAYLTNPQLREERANLRAIDEKMPTAQSGWHPTISGTAGLTYYQGYSNYLQKTSMGSMPSGEKYHTPGYTGGVTVTEPIYQGGKTVASIRMARNQIMAARAKLLATEQQVLLKAVQAYVGVVEDEQLLQISLNNERVLRQQLDATNRRFQLGELSRTDVAQAQGALATATSSRQQAEGTLQIQKATYLQVIGVGAPPNLVPPQPLKPFVHSQQQAISIAVHNNPNVVAALFTEGGQKDNVNVQIAGLMPKVSAELAYMHMKNQGYGNSIQDNKYAELAFQVPVYQGGGQYAAVRQARQTALSAYQEVNVQRRTALQLAAASWQQMEAAQRSMKSNRLAVAANIAALAGVERQALTGTSSTLEVLQQQQTLLQSQQALVQTVATLVTSTYQVASAIGRLTAVDLKLPVPLYDDRAYYNAVKDRWVGIGDYAVNQPGR